MRRKGLYIHTLNGWPSLTWSAGTLAPVLTKLCFRQGRFLGKMEGLGFVFQTEAALLTLTEDVLKSSEIEGEMLDQEQVRSSVARKLGLDIAGLVPSDRHVDGVVEMTLDATQNYLKPLSAERLFSWHSALFPGGRSGMHKIVTGAWRTNAPDDPMQVVSGALGKEKVHFEAPESARVKAEMKVFIDWFNREKSMDLILKAALAHLWFLTVHPFEDGNGRIARALSDMVLCRADQTGQRYYSMSAQMRKDRKSYYDVLEKTQKGTLDVTGWMLWYLDCMDKALAAADKILSRVLSKAEFWQQHRDTPLNSRQKLMLNKLLDHFEGKLTTSKWAKITKTSQDTALRDVQDLLQRGLLEKDDHGGRSTSYSLPAHPTR